MRRRHDSLRSLAFLGCSLALFGLSLVLGGCKQSDSILLVEVAGPATLAPLQLSVTVTADLNDARNFLVPAMPRDVGDPITLPASFTIALDRSHSAPITISIDALGDNGPLNFSGTTKMQHIEIGGQTIIAVMLIEGQPPGGIDGGADAGDAGPSDAREGGTAGSGGAGGTGGSGGAGGTGGSGGAGGRGGSGGVDAAAGADGAAGGDEVGMGLDGATD
jgi:hypothetical protein